MLRLVFWETHMKFAMYFSRDYHNVLMDTQTIKQMNVV